MSSESPQTITFTWGLVLHSRRDTKSSLFSVKEMESSRKDVDSAGVAENRRN